MELNNEREAIAVLIQAAEIGLKAGAYSMGDARYILKAVEFLAPDYFNPPTSDEMPQ